MNFPTDLKYVKSSPPWTNSMAI